MLQMDAGARKGHANMLENIHDAAEVRIHCAGRLARILGLA